MMYKGRDDVQGKGYAHNPGRPSAQLQHRAHAVWGSQPDPSAGHSTALPTPFPWGTACPRLLPPKHFVTATLSPRNAEGKKSKIEQRAGREDGAWRGHGA